MPGDFSRGADELSEPNYSQVVVEMDFLLPHQYCLAFSPTATT